VLPIELLTRAPYYHIVGGTHRDEGVPERKRTPGEAGRYRPRPPFRGGERYLLKKPADEPADSRDGREELSHEIDQYLAGATDLLQVRHLQTGSRCEPLK
jgi:hypothetical protein